MPARYCPYRNRADFSSTAIRPTQHPPIWASGDLSAELNQFRITPCGGSMSNLHLNRVNPSPFAMPLAAMRGIQVQNYRQTRVQSGVCPSQTYAYQGFAPTTGGHYSGQIPFNPHHGAHPVDDTIVFPPQPVLPGYSTAMAYKPDILCQSSTDPYAAPNSNQMITDWHSQTTRLLGVHTPRPNRQAAIPPQQSPPRKQDLSNLSSTTPQFSLPASDEDASTVDNSPREAITSKETPFATEGCPFHQCRKMYGRPQELERHIREHHLPYYIYCEQPGCNWTGNRRCALRNHLVDKHSGVPMSKLEAFTIYDASGLVKQLLNKDINVGQAVVDAQSLFQEKAVQLGKLGVWQWHSTRELKASTLGV